MAALFSSLTRPIIVSFLFAKSKHLASTVDKLTLEATRDKQRFLINFKDGETFEATRTQDEALVQYTSQRVHIHAAVTANNWEARWEYRGSVILVCQTTSVDSLSKIAAIETAFASLVPSLVISIGNFHFEHDFNELVQREGSVASTSKPPQKLVSEDSGRDGDVTTTNVGMGILSPDRMTDFTAKELRALSIQLVERIHVDHIVEFQILAHVLNEPAVHAVYNKGGPRLDTLVKFFDGKVDLINLQMLLPRENQAKKTYVRQFLQIAAGHYAAEAHPEDLDEIRTQIEVIQKYWESIAPKLSTSHAVFKVALSKLFVDGLAAISEYS
jgi:hypothetical protein